MSRASSTKIPHSIRVLEKIPSVNADLVDERHEKNGIEDHIHVLVRGCSSCSPASIAHDLKSSSSYTIIYEHLCNTHFDWQDGYAAMTVSPKDVKRVIEYIRHQKKNIMLERI